MNTKISTRRQYLFNRKNQGDRVTIGFAGIADLRSFIGLEYISGMMKAASDYDVNFINMGGAVKYSLFDDINFIQNYLKNFQFIKKPLVDGMVTWASSLWDFMNEDKLIEVFSSLRPLPIVDIGHMEIPGATHLKIDNNSAMKQLMNHLIDEHGYSKFAFFGADVSNPHWNRLFVFQKELKNHGISELDNSVYMAKSLNSNHIAEQVELLLSNYEIKDRKNIDAIVTTTDIIASEIIEQLANHGISVPKDVAVTGYNNWYEGITARSPLTTIDLSYFKRGYAAVEYLIDKIIQNDDKTNMILFNPMLVVRQSCGCLEHSVSQVEKKDDLNLVPMESEGELRSYLKKSASKIFLYQDDESISEIINCFFSDLYEKSEKSKMLLWFQNVLQNLRKQKDFDSDVFHDEITKFRKIVMTVIKNEPVDTILHIEDIFHQMRTLVSVFQKYESIADRENPYQMNNISEQAMSFVSSENVEGIFETLSSQLCKFDIPGAVLALTDNMTYSFVSPKIAYIYPDTNNEASKFIGQKIEEPHLFPKEIFPKDRQYSVILEVLHHSDKYFGYAFFEMKNPNIANYDVLRMLLSNALYSIYKKKQEGQKTFSVSQSQLETLFSANKNDSVVLEQKKRSRLTLPKITDYLLNNIEKKTDVEKMAQHFMVSRSYLSQKTKELSGYSIQTLHEKLKIEQAKNMLNSGNFELAEISDKLGFINQNYFSNVFKKNTGLSPRNWLKRNG